MKFTKEYIESFKSPIEFAINWNAYMASKHIINNIRPNIIHIFEYELEKDIRIYKKTNSVVYFKNKYFQIDIDNNTDFTKDVIISVVCLETNNMLTRKFSIDYLKTSLMEAVIPFDIDMEFNACQTCKKKDIKLSRCASCGLVKYCSKECQRANWKEHKDICSNVPK